MEDTLKTVEKSIHKFVTDVPQALVNSGLDIDLKKLNIEDGKNIQDLISSFPKSFTDEINKGTHMFVFYSKENNNVSFFNDFIVHRRERENFSHRTKV